MQTCVTISSAWQQLKNREITCESALKLLVNERGVVNLDLLDSEVSCRFFREVPNRRELPPVIPLLLWRNCYYLGSPVALSTEDIKKLSDRTNTSIKIIPISDKSYRTWFLTHNFNANSISTSTLVNPLTGEKEQEDISEITELYLKKAADQIGRIKTIISAALRNRASDIHLEPSVEGLRVRYRIDGILRDITTLPPDVGRKAIVALKVMSNMDIAESRRPQDGRIGENYTSGEETELGLDMRVSTLPCVGGEKAVIRLLPRQNPFNGLQDLGFSPKKLAIYKSWLHQPQGMIIITGPTGSGKTSTLYNSLQAVATENVNVVTVEDPVEYVLPRITQTGVHESAGMTFAAGLRAILRQDPDIIMVGEIRDGETAETAIRAALTGHLVLTTLHTNDAVSAIPRLKDIGPDPSLIGDALLGIVAQRLVRKVCPHCAEPYTPTNADLRKLGLSMEEALPPLTPPLSKGGQGLKRNPAVKTEISLAPPLTQGEQRLKPNPAVKTEISLAPPLSKGEQRLKPNPAVKTEISLAPPLTQGEQGLKPNPAVKTEISLAPPLTKGGQGGWRRGRGCPKCFHSGYLGREAIVELLNIDDTVRQLIYEGTMTQLHRYLGEIKFDSFRVAAIEKVTTGITRLEEVLRVLPHSALSRKS